MNTGEIYINAIGIVYVMGVIWLSNRFWSRSVFIKIAPIFSPASFELMLIFFGIKSVDYLTMTRFFEMIFLGLIFFVAFILARYEGSTREKEKSKDNENS